MSLRKFLIKILKIKPDVKIETVYVYPKSVKAAIAEKIGSKPVKTSTSLAEIIGGTNKNYGVRSYRNISSSQGNYKQPYNINFMEFNSKEEYTIDEYKEDFCLCAVYLVGATRAKQYVENHEDHLRFCFQNKVAEGRVVFDWLRSDKEAIEEFNDSFYSSAEIAEKDFFSDEFVENFGFLKEKQLDLSISAPDIAQRLLEFLEELEDKMFIKKND